MSEEPDKPSDPLLSVKLSDVISQSPATPKPSISDEIIGRCFLPFIVSLVSGIFSYISLQKMAHPEQFWGALTVILPHVLGYSIVAVFTALLCVYSSIFTLVRLVKVLKKHGL